MPNISLGPLYGQLVFDFGDISNGNHTLTITVVEVSSIWIDYILMVDTSGDAPTSTASQAPNSAPDSSFSMWRSSTSLATTAGISKSSTLAAPNQRVAPDQPAMSAEKSHKQTLLGIILAVVFGVGSIVLAFIYFRRRRAARSAVNRTGYRERYADSTSQSNKSDPSRCDAKVLSEVGAWPIYFKTESPPVIMSIPSEGPENDASQHWHDDTSISPYGTSCGESTSQNDGSGILSTENLDREITLGRNNLYRA